MTIASRRILTGIFIVLFLVSAPIVILISAGFRLNWASQELYRPGLIALDVEPRPTRMTIDGKASVVKNGPLRLSGLAPGLHVVRMERDGFFAWEGSLLVKSGEATSLANLRLFRQAAAETIASGVQRAILSPNRRYLALEMQNPPSLALLDMDSGSLSTLLESLPGTLDELLWLPGSSNLGIRTTENGIQTLSIVDFNGQQEKLSLTLTAETQLRWSATRGDRLYLMDGGTLYQYDLGTGTKTPILADAEDWYEEGDTLYVLTTAGNILLISGSQDPFLVYSSSGDASPAKFLPSPRGFVTLEDDGAGEVTVLKINGRTAKSVLAERAQWASWQPSGQTLVFGGPFDIAHYDTATEDIELIRRTSTVVDSVQWVGGSQYLLAKEESALRIVDTEQVIGPQIISHLSKTADVFLNTAGDRIAIVAEGKLLVEPL